MILPSQERRELQHLEQIIDRGLSTFREVGEALARIRDKRLYRAEFADFATYCRTRWKFTRRHADRLIAGAATASDLGTIGLTVNEAQARELAPLPPDQRREVYDAATDGGTRATTAAELRDLTGRALAGLSPEEQLAVLQGNEDRVLRQAAEEEEWDRAKTEARRDAVAELAKVKRLLERAESLLSSLPRAKLLPYRRARAHIRAAVTSVGRLRA